MGASVANRVPKYVQISDSVRKGLKEGRWLPGEKLPPCREFVKRFEVTPVTVWKALDELGKEGLVHRIQGKGTFVSEQPRSLRTELIGVALRTRGDSFGITFDAMVQHLKQHNCTAMLFDMEGQPDTLHDDWRAHFSALLRNDVRSLIMEGAIYQPFAYLQAHEDELPPLTFIRVFESDIHFARANSIVSDWEMGGYLGARELLQAGFDKLTYLTFGVPSEAPVEFGSTLHYNWLVMHGIERALTEAGKNPQSDVRVVFDTVSRQETPHLAEALASGFRGVFCLGDVRAPKVYRVATELGLTIGQEVGVCGYFNTQWANLVDPPLTSVCIREEELGRLAACAVEERWEGRHIKVAPEIVARQSTRLI